MPVCIFSDLDQISEVQYFLDINGTQRGVSKTLQLEVAKFTAEPESLEDVRGKLFHELNDRIESPLQSKMSPTRSIRGKISHVAFKSAIDPILELSTIRNFNFEQKIKFLINALNALQSTLLKSDAPKDITNTALFQSFFMSFPEILRQIELKHGDFKEESFEDVLRAFV